MKERWDGQKVCPRDWEPRNILDFFRVPGENMSVPWTRDDTTGDAPTALTATTTQLTASSDVYTFYYDCTTGNKRIVLPPSNSASYRLSPVDIIIARTDASANTLTVAPYSGLFFTGAAGSYLTTPDTTALSITGDIELEAFLVGNYTAGVNQYITSKWLSAGNQRSYILGVDLTGHIVFFWSDNGTAFTQATSTIVLPVANYSAVGIKVSFDVDNGAGGNTATFYYSTDPTLPWTQLGTPVITAGVTSIFNSTAPLQHVGIDNNAGNGLLAGYVFDAKVRNGINGTLVYSAPMSAQATGTTSFIEASSNQAVVTVINIGGLSFTPIDNIVGSTNILPSSSGRFTPNRISTWTRI
jgi:hypothetical protein